MLAETYDQLGFAFKEAGEMTKTYALAEEYFQKALHIRQRNFGADHLATAISYNNLGFVYNAWGRYTEAVEHNKRALETRRRNLAKGDSRTVQSLGNLAYSYQGLGRLELAEPLVREMLDLGLADLVRSARGKSLRLQQKAIVAAQHELDAYISHVINEQRVGHVDDETPEMSARLRRRARELLLEDMSDIRFPDIETDRSYRYVIQWKGMPFSRQQGLRMAAAQPAAAAQLAELRRTAGRLAALAFSPAEPEELASWRRRFQALSDENSRLEAELLARVEMPHAGLTPNRLRELLPDGVALVDLFEYTYIKPLIFIPRDLERDRRLVAFVVRRDRPIVQVDLGSTLHLPDSVYSWYWDNIPGQTHQRAWTQVQKPAEHLRETLWKPLEKHLSGIGIILVCPDNELALIPWGALPGEKQGTYLLEERSFALVSSPQTLGVLLERKTDHPDMRAERSLLLIGDAAFGPSPPRRARVNGVAEPHAGIPKINALPYDFLRLPNTAMEIDTLAQIFGETHPGSICHVYKGIDASEATLRAHIMHHRYLHVATHGYFASASLPDDSMGVNQFIRKHGPSLFQKTTGWLPFFGEKQDLIENHPGLLSGLAPAGVNRSQRADPDLDATENDGILTAADLAGLDLSAVEMVVLSACDTGLGATAAADGPHGLERAFQAAGAHTTVTSHWKVDDDATRALMVEFYRRLWDKGKPVSKLKALRRPS